jgi:hypothetical protein
MTDQPDDGGAEITRVRGDIQQRIDRSQELNRLLVDNLICAAQFLESCRQAMKRLDFTQATIDAHASEDHRLIAQRLAVEIRKLNAEIDLERQLLRYMRTTNHQQPPRPAGGNPVRLAALAGRPARHRG